MLQETEELYRHGGIQAEGLLHSKALGGWQRGGLRVGSLPMPKGPLVIEYDFRPTIFGAQGQSFVSPSVTLTDW